MIKACFLVSLKTFSLTPRLNITASQQTETDGRPGTVRSWKMTQKEKRNPQIEGIYFDELGSLRNKIQRPPLARLIDFDRVSHRNNIYGAEDALAFYEIIISAPSHFRPHSDRHGQDSDWDGLFSQKLRMANLFLSFWKCQPGAVYVLESYTDLPSRYWR